MISQREKQDLARSEGADEIQDKNSESTGWTKFGIFNPRKGAAQIQVPRITIEESLIA